MLFYLISDLLPYTYYEVQLTACTSAGCTAGNTTAVTTSEGLPEGKEHMNMCRQFTRSRGQTDYYYLHNANYTFRVCFAYNICLLNPNDTVHLAGLL